MAGLNGIGSIGALQNLNLTATGSVTDTTVTKESTSAEVTTAAVTTNVSSTGGLIAQALSTSDVRLDRVAELQSAIANGSYSVPAGDVASKIIGSLLS